MACLPPDAAGLVERAELATVLTGAESAMKEVCLQGLAQPGRPAEESSAMQLGRPVLRRLEFLLSWAQLALEALAGWASFVEAGPEEEEPVPEEENQSEKAAQKLPLQEPEPGAPDARPFYPLLQAGLELH